MAVCTRCCMWGQFDQQQGPNAFRQGILLAQRQLERIPFQRGGDPFQRHYAHVRFAALNFADVLKTDFCQSSQLRLAEPMNLTLPLQGHAEAFAKGGHHAPPFHCRGPRRCCVVRPGSSRLCRLLDRLGGDACWLPSSTDSVSRRDAVRIAGAPRLRHSKDKAPRTATSWSRSARVSSGTRWSTSLGSKCSSRAYSCSPANSVRW